MTHTERTFKRGDKVRVKRIWVRGECEHGGGTGTVACVPGDGGGVPPHLYVIVLDGEKDEEGEPVVRGVDPSLLEPCST